MAGLTCRDLMSAPVKTVTSDSTLEQIATLMAENKIHSIPVVEGGKLVGLVGRRTLCGASSQIRVPSGMSKLNSKFEARNSKRARMFKIQMTKKIRCEFWFLVI